MLVQSWLFVGVVAILATAGAVLSQDQGQAVVGGALGLIAWGIFAFGAYNVEVARGGVVYEFTMPAVAMLGIAMALVPGYIMLTGPIDLTNRWRNATPRDM